MKKVILLDMDGTITPHRKPLDPFMGVQLDSMIADGWELGIVSGSKLEYMDEQLGGWNTWKNTHPKLHKFPINGTQGLQMRNEYTEFEWQWLIHDIKSADHRMRLSIGGKYIRVPDQIIDFRGSSINWCPIGRDANDKQRKRFVGLDHAFDLRLNFLNQMKTRPLFHHKTVIKLGGQTSFDIYPRGWDKSYVFKAFQDFERIYFIGDRCEPMGNDYEGFIKAGDYGIQTDGPESTGRILSEILRRSACKDTISPPIQTLTSRSGNYNGSV